MNYHILILVLVVPLALSTFTHIFNAIGFPCIHYDEGVYLRRSLHALEGLGSHDPESRFDHGQDSTSSYDHPYFGQLFLASIFDIINYPNSLYSAYPSSSTTTSDVVNNDTASAADTTQHDDYDYSLNSIQMLYFVPRVLMGVLAVVDTFLLYKIAERQYNRNIAIIASVLFAVMPISWLLRRIYLDNLLLPFLLSSILFAVYMKKSEQTSKNSDVNNNRKLLTPIPILPLISGIFLGLAIFTKIPAFTMIPLVAFVVYRSSNKSWKTLVVWSIPVILISLIWPAYALSAGNFDEWIDGVLWQATGRLAGWLGPPQAFSSSFNSIFNMDPVLMILGIAGIVFSAIKKDYFILLMVIPYLIFVALIGWMSYFHWILLIPAFCIAAGVLIEGLSNKITRRKENNNTIYQILSFALISGLIVFGLVSTIMVIMTNVSSSQLESGAMAMAAYQAQHDNNHNNITIISGPVYSWIFKYVFGQDHAFLTRDSSIPIFNKNVILIVDITYKSVLARLQVEDDKQIERLLKIYNATQMVSTIVDVGIHHDSQVYPYTNVKLCSAEGNEVRINS